MKGEGELTLSILFLSVLSPVLGLILPGKVVVP